MRVYHFLEAKWAQEGISKKRLKVAMIDKLNDPFEFCAGFLAANAAIEKTFRDWKANISKEYGLLCFSKKWTNPFVVESLCR